MIRRHPWPLTAVLVLVWLASAAGMAAAASRYDPRLRFKTITTRRFDIHYHQGEEVMARRLAVIAEEVASALDASLGPAAGRVQVILVNQNDLPNGWATPVPYNLIEIAAAGPGGENVIGNTEDWLRLVFTHEYTHVVHLGRSSGWIAGLRWVFGRNAALFPNLTMPVWAIEGIATFEESARTGDGRVHAGDFRQIPSAAAAASTFEPLDRAGGGLDDWPAGNAAYAYGALFHQYLARRYGEDSLRRLTDTSGRRLPYFGTTAFRRVFGRPLGELWADFDAEMRTSAAREAGTATQVTHEGFTVTSPTFAPDGRLYYSSVNPRGFPSLMAIDRAGAEPRRVADRYLGERSGLSGTLLVFDEFQVSENVALQSDLSAIETSTGRRTRLTHGLRAADPAVSPDGTMIAFTQQRDDRRDLVLSPIDARIPALGQISTLQSAPDTEFRSPSWSPDGRTIAAERREPGALPQVVVIDVATRAVRVVASSAQGRAVSPAFLPDGRRIVFASTRDGGPFRLFAVDLTSDRVSRLEGTGPSAESPAVSADGGTLAFVGYTTAGYDLFTLPLADAIWTPLDPAAPAAARVVTGADAIAAPAPDYSPLRYSSHPASGHRQSRPTAERRRPASRPSVRTRSVGINMPPASAGPRHVAVPTGPSPTSTTAGARPCS